MLLERLRTIARFARGHIPELVVVAFGLGLRISLTKTFDVTLGYDFPTHLGFVNYIREHWQIPPYNFNFSTYNPALYYAVAALLLKLGCSLQAVGRISIVCSCLQLLVMWIGVEVYLRETRLGRVLSLLLFATLPAALHIAGFVSNHVMDDLFCTAGALLAPQVILRRGRSAIHYAIGAGVCLGLALLTKISGVTILQAFLIVVVVAVWRSRDRVLAARALFPGTAVLFGVVALIAGWHYARHKVMYGRFVLTGYDPFNDTDPVWKVPYIDRRTFGFLGYWDSAVIGWPFWPSGITPYSRFWPVLVATTFSDYYNFAFVPRPPRGVPATLVNGKPMRTAALAPAVMAVIGGLVLAVLVVVAWLVSARTLWRRDDHARLLLIVAVGLATLAQVHFSIRFYIDRMGPTKGTYLQFVGPIYCALAGAAIGWLWNRRRPIARALAVVGMVAIALSATYSVFAKVVVPLWG